MLCLSIGRDGSQQSVPGYKFSHFLTIATNTENSEMGNLIVS